MLQPGDTSEIVPGGEAHWGCSAPEAEIARLRECLANAEERRRLEAVLFEDKAKRVEAELEHCRAEGVVFSRLFEERDALVGRLKAELSEAESERDTYKRELAEARQQLERRRSAMCQVGAMRQASGPLPPTAAERIGGLVLTRPERGISEPQSSLRQLSPSSEFSRVNHVNHTMPNTLASVAVAATHAMDLDPTRRVSGGGATSARGAIASRNRLGSSDQVVTQPTGSSLHVNAAIGGGGGSGRTSAPSTIPRNIGTPMNTPDEGPNSSRPLARSTPSKTNTSVDRNDDVSMANDKSSEKPVEMTITVPRALTPDELLELAQQPQFEEPPTIPPQIAPRSLFTLPPTSQVQPQQPWSGGKQAAAVNRQASAPYAPSVTISSPTSAENWCAFEYALQTEGRWLSAGAAPPPPVRVVSTSQQTILPKPGSATIPTAAGLSLNSVSLMAQNSIVPTASSQARLGVAYRR